MSASSAAERRVALANQRADRAERILKLARIRADGARYQRDHARRSAMDFARRAEAAERAAAAFRIALAEVAPTHPLLTQPEARAA